MINDLIVNALTGSYLIEKYAPQMVFAAIVMTASGVAIYYLSKRI